MITETNIVTQEVRQRLPYSELGRIMLETHGEEACQKAYGTTVPSWVGEYALQYRDINEDGTLN